jgi:hypothetical protein
MRKRKKGKENQRERGLKTESEILSPTGILQPFPKNKRNSGKKRA